MSSLINLPWSFRSWGGNPGEFLLYPSGNLGIVWSQPVPNGKLWLMYHITARFIVTVTPGVNGQSFAELTNGLFMIPPGQPNTRDLGFGSLNPGTQNLITPDLLNTLTLPIPLSTVGNGPSASLGEPTGNTNQKAIEMSSMPNDPYIFPPQWRLAASIYSQSNVAQPQWTIPSNGGLYVQMAEINSCY